MKAVQEDIKKLYLLDSNKRRHIITLVSSRSDGMTFKDISRETGLKPTGLAYHLKILTENGLLEKVFRSQEGRRDYSFYVISGGGKRILELADSILGKYFLDEGYLRPVEGGFDPPRSISIIPMRFGPRCLSVRRV